MKEQTYDELLPVSLHRANNGTYYLLDRHNDELATFGGFVEVEDMERIVSLINREADLSADCQPER